MRRLFAILMLFVLGLPLLPSAEAAMGLPAAQQGQLMACCRRDGAHHCAMHMPGTREAASRERVVSAPPVPCPFCPKTLAVAAQGPIFAPPPAAVQGVGFRFSVFALPSQRSRVFGAPAREHDSRGPPVKLFS